jgi:hypothetical protein
MLDLTRHTCYIGEVLRPDGGLLDSDLITYWYQYFKLQPGDELYTGIEKLLGYRFAWPDKRPLAPSRLWLYRCTRALWGLPRPILKDPMASFSAAYLARTFDMQVVCLIRHPAAVVASLKRARWHFDFRNFLHQSDLLDDWLAPILHNLKGHPPDIIEEGALLWRCIYHVLDAYIRQNPGWIVWRHEDISAAPLKAFASIYRQLGLPYQAAAQQQILLYSDEANPVLARNGHLLKRNTGALINRWRKELTPAEIRRIREIVEPVSHQYYQDSEW